MTAHKMVERTGLTKDSMAAEMAVVKVGLSAHLKVSLRENVRVYG